MLSCRIAGIRDVVGFHADNVAELRTVFEEAVDDYLAYRVERGRNRIAQPAVKSACAYRPGSIQQSILRPPAGGCS